MKSTCGVSGVPVGDPSRLSRHTARVTAKPAIAVGDPTYWRYAARITAQGSNKKVSSPVGDAIIHRGSIPVASVAFYSGDICSP